MLETLTPETIQEMIDITKLPVSGEQGTPEVGYNPRKDFIEKIPAYSKEYVAALQKDILDPKRIFVWGEMNPNMRREHMFDQAILYAIEAEVLQLELDIKGELSPLDQSSLNGYNSKLETQFGPENTSSGEVISRMRKSIKEVLKDGLGKEGVKTIVRTTKH